MRLEIFVATTLKVQGLMEVLGSRKWTKSNLYSLTKVKPLIRSNADCQSSLHTMNRTDWQTDVFQYFKNRIYMKCVMTVNRT